ncbi:hypothetical protein HPNQ4044_0639 [Helicobacter pylori NQ4044]|uniref:Uncharacterized protein n=1 Tax=Helicobacter pylori NQ4044 TaxID=992028 RepID=J0JFM2_HELPX|nr:hypothetical protein HPNQ4044_0639 [Helicobacter pylori NQ4044]
MLKGRAISSSSLKSKFSLIRLDQTALKGGFFGGLGGFRGE